MKVYDENGLPADKSYLECGLPKFLKEAIDEMQIVWNCYDNDIKDDEHYYHRDAYFCNLQSDINVAEVEQIISSEQAWYLREKYLRMIRSNEL